MILLTVISISFSALYIHLFRFFRGTVELFAFKHAINVSLAIDLKKNRYHYETSLCMKEKQHKINILNFFQSGLVYLLILGVKGYYCNWSHLVTHTQSVGLPWTRDQPVAEASTCIIHNIHKR